MIGPELDPRAGPAFQAPGAASGNQPQDRQVMLGPSAWPSHLNRVKTAGELLAGSCGGLLVSGCEDASPRVSSLAFLKLLPLGNAESAVDLHVGRGGP